VNDRASEGVTLTSQQHRGAEPPARSRRRPRTRTTSPMRKAENRAGLTLISPTFVIVLVVVVLPIVWTIMLAFQRLRLLNLRTSGLFGTYTLDNFRSVFSSPGFWEALRTTFVYSVCGTASSICIGLIAALAVRRFFHGRTIVRGALLLPYVAPVVATTFVWKTMLSPQSGIANDYGTRFLGWERPVAFLSQRSIDIPILGWHVGIPIALITVIAFEAWRSFPFAFLFLTARLQAVPAMLEEAAMCDGATISQRFRYVIWPQLLPTIAVLSVLRFIWTFNSFDDIYLLTGGGAGTEVVSVRVFDFLTARGNIGAASAQALVLAAVLALLVSLYLWRMNTREESV
jgi:multiple sugar transport system permease protein